MFIGYLEAVEDVVKIGNLNYKIVAEDFYNSFCEHLFFAELEVCESQFYQDLITEDFKYVMKELYYDIDYGMSPYSVNTDSIWNWDIWIDDNNDSQPIQTLKDNGWV